MRIPDKNNPDGLGSYGKSPSRFVERPRDKAKHQPNDATEAPMGHAAVDQEVFDAEQEELAKKLASKSPPPTPGVLGQSKKKAREGGKP